MHDADNRDRALMHRLKQGDVQALVELIQFWELPLLKFSYRYIQDANVARDLVQEAFIRVYRYCDGYDESRPFSTWLFSIQANLCRNHQRWRSRHAEASLEAAPEPRCNQTPRDVLRNRELVREVASCIARLPHRLRVAVLLYYYEDMSYQAIAEVLECSVRTVESRLYRARRMLSALLEQPVGERPAGLVATDLRVT